MMTRGLISHASITINAPIAKVWDALVTPATIKKYMFGTNVVADWREGGPITWKGEYQGRSYEDKGVILELKERERLCYTHFSPLSGDPDLPEHYHTVTVTVSDEGSHTMLSLDQDNNPTEESRAHTAKNWQGMLESLKGLLEHASNGSKSN
jgi:uncharacterized protein YndB with AHSA1/START domain